MKSFELTPEETTVVLCWAPHLESDRKEIYGTRPHCKMRVYFETDESWHRAIGQLVLAIHGFSVIIRVGPFIDAVPARSSTADESHRPFHGHVADANRRRESDGGIDRRHAHEAEAEGETLVMATFQELEAEIIRLHEVLAKQDGEICQTLGKALGYPWYKDDQRNFPGATEEQGVCVGEHVAESLAMEAATWLNKFFHDERAAFEAGYGWAVDAGSPVQGPPVAHAFNEYLVWRKKNPAWPPLEGRTDGAQNDG